MEKASNLTPFAALALRCKQVEGICEKHGPSVALLHPRSGQTEWTCGDCAIEAKGAEIEANLKRERKLTLDGAAYLPERYQGAQFETTTPSQKKAFLTARAFRDSIAINDAWAVLSLIGGTGTGKTLLASVVGQSIIDKLGRSVRYCTANEMIAEIQAAYSTEGKTEASEVLRFTQYELLILDEIDFIRESDNAKLLLTEVINKRYNAKKPVIVISNQAIEKLSKFIGDRVCSRLQENQLVCLHDWPDQRPLAA